MSETPESDASSGASNVGAQSNSEGSPDNSTRLTPPPYRPPGGNAELSQSPPPPPPWQDAPTAANPLESAPSTAAGSEAAPTAANPSEAAPSGANPWEVAPSTPNPWQPAPDATVQMPLGSTGGHMGSAGGWQAPQGPAGPPQGPPQGPPTGPPLGPPVAGFGTPPIPGQASGPNNRSKGRVGLIVGIIIVLCLIVGGVVAALAVSSSNSSAFTVAVDSCSIAADGTVVAKGTVTSEKSATADITISFTDADSSAGLGTRAQSVESSPQGTTWTETIEVGDTVQKVTCTASA